MSVLPAPSVNCQTTNIFAGGQIAFFPAAFFPIPAGKRALKKVTPILGGFSRDDYVTERLWATAPDGVEVPISLVYRKGLAKKDGSDHMLLHG